MAKKYIHRQNDNSNHVWEKKNLITLIDKKSGYDIYYCKKCGVECKQRTIGILEFSTNSLKQKQNFILCPNYVEVISMDDEPYDVGNIIILGVMDFDNRVEGKFLTPGSEHKIINPPEEYIKKYPNSHKNVWVMGTTQPVRVLEGEFKYK